MSTMPLVPASADITLSADAGEGCTDALQGAKKKTLNRMKNMHGCAIIDRRSPLRVPVFAATPVNLEGIA